MYQSKLCFLLVLCVGIPSLSQENHRTEPVTGVLFTRSAFAHGYRHGYEAGYHQGNIDINMARPARTRFSELRGIPLGYQDDFGPRNSFLYGFQFGLTAGYSDGYGGKEFRVIATMRQVAGALDSTLPDLKVRRSDFDRGLILGYEDGFGKKSGQAKNGLPARATGVGSCKNTDGKAPTGGDPDYCEGYGRGLILGRKDASAAHGEHGLLEASK